MPIAGVKAFKLDPSAHGRDASKRRELRACMCLHACTHAVSRSLMHASCRRLQTVTHARSHRNTAIAEAVNGGGVVVFSGLSGGFGAGKWDGTQMGT